MASNPADTTLEAAPPLPGATVTAAEGVLVRAQWQEVVFAEQPGRRDLLSLQPGWPLRPIRLRVHRNRPFEHAEPLLAKFLAYAGLKPTFAYSDYDDSLALGTDGEADVEIVWLDYARYRIDEDPDAFLNWLAGRLGALRKTSTAPILLADRDRPAGDFNRRLGETAAALPGVHLCPVSDIAAGLGGRYASQRLVELTGSDLTDAAWIEISRHFGLKWLPATACPPIKAVAVDLDYTLYDGALGEDGPDGVRATDQHLAIQRRLAELADAGLFLAILSRNVEEDAWALFEARDDFLLDRKSFSAAAISWDVKAEGLLRIADALHIAADAILVVDDNAGELAAMAQTVPDLKALHAGPDRQATLRALEFYPGLFRWHGVAADRLRRADIRSAEVREELRKASGTADDYLRSLQVRLGYALDPADERSRLHQLSVKTNQFNLALARLSEADVEAYLTDPEKAVAAIWLADRLSDSGLIGAVFASRAGDTVTIDELCLSCRALGRRLEDIMLGDALAGLLRRLPARRVDFRYVCGPRNGPARNWLAQLAGPLPDEADGQIGVDRGDLVQRLARDHADAVSREWRDEPR